MNPPTEKPASWRDNLPFLAGLLLLTLASFWPVGGFGFIGYDDYDYVYQNAHVQSGLNFDSVTWAFTSATAGNWHPLTWLSLMLDCEVFGLNPQEEHWVNLFFHTASTLLLFAFLRQWTGARWRSFLVALLFACHPLHVQSVAWISERKDVLSTFFALLTLMAYARYCRSKTKVDYGLMLWLFALGLMAKPMLVTLPLILLLLDFWPLGRVNDVRSAKNLLIEKIPLFALCLASALVTVWAQNSDGAIVSVRAVPYSDRCLHALVSYALYLGKLIWPANLAIFYPLPYTTPDDLVWLGALLLLTVLTIISFWLRRSQPYLLVGWLWFLITLLPVIGLVQVGSQSIADRYMYLPSIGLFVIVAWGMAEIAGTASKRWILAGVGTIIVVACVVDTRYQLDFWRSNLTLFQQVVKVTPENNSLGYFYLGISYGEAGNLSESERCLKLSLKTEPAFLLAKKRLGNVLLVENKPSEAEPYLREIARAEPNNALSRVALGLALAGQKKYIEAQAEYEAARQIRPNDNHLNGLVTANAPKAEAAARLAELQNQINTHETPAVLVHIALTEGQLGNYGASVSHYEKALALDTNSVAALNNLAWLLATCPDASVRNGSQAIQLARHACDLTGYKTTVFLGTLAAAQAEAGRFAEAVATAQKACANAAANQETNLLNSNENLLDIYRNHQAHHQPIE